MNSTQKIRSNVYLDSKLKEISRNTPIFDLDIEQILPNESDYKLMKEARKNGEKTYSFDEVMEKLNEN